LTVDAVTREQLREQLQSGDPLVLIDALSALSYNTSHLPGAINITPEWVDARAPKLIPDLDADVVVYCSGAMCDSSTVVANRLRELGYRHVRHYVEGKRDWQAAGLPLEGRGS
jgi:rhodanese-related sulfurtransferase